MAVPKSFYLPSPRVGSAICKVFQSEKFKCFGLDPSDLLQTSGRRRGVGLVVSTEALGDAVT